ncbi:unnamed protein product [Rotaria socialis]|uniref:UPF3 domain-containing protein n=1 Tax=Rotaria socialis TaxID=392032 RepID=A0A820LID3_9BILA|nr:unnamed protein product [Rotaria socialis]CAF3421528.1 unnamed protein product [Rotaria socialis]CAF3434483.1 unnamed protein product [Rotaria socialis]CAF3538983.1 unnamed protein product [Rotaria socialis]CAF3557684.1 unnamed protein product [Rotaria socialis]
MVDGASIGAKQQSSVNNRSFNDQNQTKIVLRRLPPTLTSEQFLEIVSPLPDHDYYRFCKADISLGQQYAFSRAYLNISNRQDLIVFTEKFQGYVFVDKNGNEYICSVEYAPNQCRPKSEQQLRKDPKMNSIEQDPEYQTFVTNMNAPPSATEALPNAEIMLEEIEKKQREIQDNKNKSGATTTPLLEFLKRKREERKQEKMMRIQQAQQHRNNKQSFRNNPSNIHDDSRPSSGRNMNEDDYNASSRYGGGDRSNRQQRGYDKSDYRTGNQEQKRSNANDYGGNKASKNRDHQNTRSKQQHNSKESKVVTNMKSKNEESSQIENQAKRDTTSLDTINNSNDNSQQSQNDERPNSSNKGSSASSQKNANGVIKNRPSIQIYNPAERARLRKQHNPSS